MKWVKLTSEGNGEVWVNLDSVFTMSRVAKGRLTRLVAPSLGTIDAENVHEAFIEVRETPIEIYRRANDPGHVHKEAHGGQRQKEKEEAA